MAEESGPVECDLEPAGRMRARAPGDASTAPTRLTGSNDIKPPVSYAPPPGLDPDTWDGWAMLTLSQLILRLLSAGPPPPGAQTAEDLQRWAAALEADGRARLLAGGLAALRAV